MHKYTSIPYNADIKLNIESCVNKFYSMFNRQTTRNMVTTFSVTVRTDARKQNAVRTVIRSSFGKHMTLKD